MFIAVKDIVMKWGLLKYQLRNKISLSHIFYIFWWTAYLDYKRICGREKSYSSIDILATLTSSQYLWQLQTSHIQSINLSMYLSINLCIYLSIYLSINPSIYQSIYLCIYLSIYLSMYLSINLSIYLSVLLS